MPEVFLLFSQFSNYFLIKCFKLSNMYYFKKMSFELSQELANDYERLFETDEGFDVIIYAGKNENVEEIHAYSNILCTRSQYFCTAFSNKWVEKKDGKYVFKKPNISPQFFKIILR